MTTYKKFLTLSFLIFIFSCHEKPSPQNDSFAYLTKVVRNTSFKKHYRAKLFSTGLNFGDEIVEMESVDTVLALSSYKDSAIVKIVGEKSNKLLFKFINRGKSEYDCLDVTNILKTGDKQVFWLYDITLTKLMKINLKKLLVAPHHYRPDTSFQLVEPCRGIKSMVWINNTTFAGCTYFHDDCRYLYINNQSKILKKAGVLPNPDPDWPEKNPKGKFGLYASCYYANMVKNPTDERTAVAYCTADRLEIYDHGIIKHIILGPQKTVPHYSFRQHGDTNDPTNIEETRFSFVKVRATSKYIYLLYSGRDHFQFAAQKILVFDWEGNPVKVIDLPSDFGNLCLREIGSLVKLYMIDQKTGDLLYLKDENS